MGWTRSVDARVPVDHASVGLAQARRNCADLVPQTSAIAVCLIFHELLFYVLNPCVLLTM